MPDRKLISDIKIMCFLDSLSPAMVIIDAFVCVLDETFYWRLS